MADEASPTRPAWDAIAELTGIGPGTTVLDVGCGTGGFCELAAARGARRSWRGPEGRSDRRCAPPAAEPRLSRRVHGGASVACRHVRRGRRLQRLPVRARRAEGAGRGAPCRTPRRATGRVQVRAPDGQRVLRLPAGAAPWRPGPRGVARAGRRRARDGAPRAPCVGERRGLVVHDAAQRPRHSRRRSRPLERWTIGMPRVPGAAASASPPRPTGSPTAATGSRIA